MIQNVCTRPSGYISVNSRVCKPSISSSPVLSCIPRFQSKGAFQCISSWSSPQKGKLILVVKRTMGIVALFSSNSLNSVFTCF